MPIATEIFRTGQKKKKRKSKLPPFYHSKTPLVLHPPEHQVTSQKYKKILVITNNLKSWVPWFS